MIDYGNRKNFWKQRIWKSISISSVLGVFGAKIAQGCITPLLLDKENSTKIPTTKLRFKPATKSQILKPF